MHRPPSRKAVVIATSVLVVLIVAVAVALSVLDSVLLKQARAQAATYSERLGRPIKIEGISTRLLFGASVRVRGVELGPAAGESLPLRRRPGSPRSCGGCRTPSSFMQILPK